MGASCRLEPGAPAPLVDALKLHPDPSREYRLVRDDFERILKRIENPGPLKSQAMEEPHLALGHLAYVAGQETTREKVQGSAVQVARYIVQAMIDSARGAEPTPLQKATALHLARVLIKSLDYDPDLQGLAAREFNELFGACLSAPPDDQVMKLAGQAWGQYGHLLEHREALTPGEPSVLSTVAGAVFGTLLYPFLAPFFYFMGPTGD